MYVLTLHVDVERNHPCADDLMADRCSWHAPNRRIIMAPPQQRAHEDDAQTPAGKAAVVANATPDCPGGCGDRA
eukprot:scaffold629246_cov25-Prasinocladus_malaysianus.AAC.1